MTKNAAVNFGYHCHDLAQNYNGGEIVESVAVTAKVDCRVFCHINSLGDKISNTAAPIQPNPFWFWEKFIICFSKTYCTEFRSASPSQFHFVGCSQNRWIKKTTDVTTCKLEM